MTDVSDKVYNYRSETARILEDAGKFRTVFGFHRKFALVQLIGEEGTVEYSWDTLHNMADKIIAKR